VSMSSIMLLLLGISLTRCWMLPPLELVLHIRRFPSRFAVIMCTSDIGDNNALGTSAS
jgi:hypothetical protein